MHRLVHIPECPSTNDEILNLITSPLKKDEVIALYTLRQTQGKGQYGNKWTTQNDKNIAISFALHPKALSHNDLAIINYYTAVILREFIANLTDTPLYIKWPNDLILKHKKISGILLEQKQQHLIIGIGINVLQTDFNQITTAGSLLTQTHQKFEPHQLAKDFYHYFANAILRENSTDKILETLNQHLYKRGQVAVFEIDGVRQNGIIRYADQDGYLWIFLEDQLKPQAFYHKEVKLLF